MISAENINENNPLNELTIKMYQQLDRREMELADRTFNEIIVMLTPAARGFIHSKIQSPYLLQQEDEILDDLWNALWQNANRPSKRWDIKRNTTCQTWAIGILYKKVTDVFRQHKKQKRVIYVHTIKDDDTTTEFYREDSEPMALDKIISSESSEKVRSAIKMMPAKYREIFWLKHIDNMKSRDIRLQTGISESTISKRLKKGEQILAALLKNIMD